MKIKFNDIKVNSEFKHLLPPLGEEQKVELEKDIIKNGCLNPLMVWQNILIDGHHRYEICTRNNIPFDLTEMEFKDKLEAMEWAWSNQKNRRNLNKYELAEIALKFKPVIEAKAKENLSLVGGDKKSENAKSPLMNPPKVIEKPINTRKELSQISGVSEDTIYKVEVIKEQGTEEIKKQAAAGELTINNAYVLTRSATEAKKKNEELENEYQEEAEREKIELEEKQKQEELQQSLPGNAVVLEKFRKPKETHIFGIDDFNNLTEKQSKDCLDHTKKYQNTISKVAELHIDNESLMAWNCVLENQTEVSLELSTIQVAIQNLIAIQNYFKGVEKNEQI
ncbi:ParB N-terminal domain-containing protein [Clostridium akagii]|uniref:ParB N-terminal domain-containing protein n=1 Tax=Clostridium akagii TaxID=91623 RepID=UPI000691DA70|nr:ParB N-terminal domain-containing protein [Clostridium akagii]